MKRRKVCLVGFAGGFDLVPWADSAWEIWGFNQFYRAIRPSERRPFHRWFELHLPSYFDRDANGNADEGWEIIAEELRDLLVPHRSADVDAIVERRAGKKAVGQARKLYPEMYGRRPVPLVYLPAANALVPGATVYPKDAVERLASRGAYHAGSFDWMVALAILEGFTHIRITGANFASGGEPISARPCLEYWLGIAEGRGIATEVLGSTDVFRIFHLARSDTPYGFAPWALVEEHEYRPPERESA